METIINNNNNIVQLSQNPPSHDLAAKQVEIARTQILLSELKGDAAITSFFILQDATRDALHAIWDAHTERRTAKRQLTRWITALTFHESGASGM